MTELEQSILDHYIANPGVNAEWKTLGTNYEEGTAAYESLFEKGLLETRKVPSKSGKTMQQKIFAA